MLSAKQPFRNQDLYRFCKTAVRLVIGTDLLYCHPEGAAARFRAAWWGLWRRMKDLLSAGKDPARRAALEGTDSRSFAPRHGAGAPAWRVRRGAQDDKDTGGVLAEARRSEDAHSVVRDGIST